jgi:hypothetical protein
MSSATPGPRCPRCRRPIAAWRLEHCVYCGESFPPDFKDGHSEPEALKWVERPAIPSDAAKQLELMKFFPGDAKATGRARPALILAGAISVVAFAVVFVLLFLIIRRSAPSFSAIVFVFGGGFLGYLGWVFLRAYRRGTR